jgi:CheY-like chemotaxis protein
MVLGTILYAEDEPSDIFFLERAFKVTQLPHLLKAVADGQAALEYLAGNGIFADRELNPLPCLVLLDINMPKKSGFEVLEWIRRQPGLRSLPVLMLTSSSHDADRETAYRLGADDFLLKPSDPLKLDEVVKLIHTRWLLPSTDLAEA